MVVCGNVIVGEYQEMGDALREAKAQGHAYMVDEGGKVRGMNDVFPWLSM